MIIQSEKKTKRKIFEAVTTAIGWIFLVLFLFMLGSHLEWKINRNIYALSLVNSSIIILVTVIVIIISFLVLTLWGIYNKRRFGKLFRRSFPIPTEIEEIADYYSLSTIEVLQLQQKNYVER
ncbi:poly-beta-1,6-N-acetyl-D-glucosamine biosynthesis protein PgaD [Neobacillus sp. PS3-12]|uniref:poly-beta-1,6-N-acetyl-D-glucosamine biosynthesis protein PgaD n=1 Tax=Neobacillus sp. PS3-12 TaxID=3070677 RepID=UPI0027DEF665|nr:poly-beta-1,6-N-acetyl-D-glucosamine biosynthesis protein PgaD [Neobacillus sp. PS3-12]WML53231.1 poly-beta-1,6-N-acetyl-D-glucosamine biosynthesis protein PgaD [Neobacillus sp. PS3-12]